MPVTDPVSSVTPITPVDDLARRRALVAHAGSPQVSFAGWREEPAMPIEPGPAIWGEDGFTFDDFLDLINPLQHIPVVSTFYREITGDSIAPGPRVLGAALFSGGPIGAAVSAAVALVDVAIESETGRDIGGHMMALFDGETGDDVAPRAVAEVEGLPWLVADATDGPREVAGLPWLVAEAQTKILARPAVRAQTAAAPSDAALRPRPIAGHVAKPELPPRLSGITPDTPKLTDGQWSLLLTSLEDSSIKPDARAKARQRQPVQLWTANGPGQAVTPPNDLTAAMNSALDKYATLSRRPAGNQVDRTF
jgi:hypothetical protein